MRVATIVLLASLSLGACVGPWPAEEPETTRSTTQSEVRITFTKPGVYRYRDTFYQGTGTVVVE
jgi:plastocyanin